MKRPTAIAGGVVIALVALGAVAVAFIWTPEMAPIDTSRQARLDPELARKGANLAALGDCNSCHTAPDGQAFAGGLPIQTPFGTIYSTNTTPDPETGIGRWSEETPGLPFLGAGEAGQWPATATIANAIADATGQRLHNLPLTAANLKAAVGIQTSAAVEWIEP